MKTGFFKNFAISAVLLVFSVSFVLGTVKVLQKGRRLQEVKNELAALQRQEEELEREKLYRESEDFVEEEARNKLNMVKPGEEVYLKPKIFGDDLLGAGTIKDKDTKKQAPGFLGSVLDKILHLFDKVK